MTAENLATALNEDTLHRALVSVFLYFGKETGRMKTYDTGNLIFFSRQAANGNRI
jgi:hypothetical protein